MEDIYERTELEIITFKSEDVITTSIPREEDETPEKMD